MESVAHLRYQSLSVRPRTDGDLLIWESVGTASAQALAGSLSQCQQTAQDTQAGALVACYQRTDVRVDPNSILQHALRVAGQDGAIRVPTALVVPADMAGFWRIYAAMMADAGIVRAVFTSTERALRWATEQAAVTKAEQQFRRRRSPATGL